MQRRQAAVRVSVLTRRVCALSLQVLAACGLQRRRLLSNGCVDCRCGCDATSVTCCSSQAHTDAVPAQNGRRAEAYPKRTVRTAQRRAWPAGSKAGLTLGPGRKKSWTQLPAVICGRAAPFFRRIQARERALSVTVTLTAPLGAQGLNTRAERRAHRLVVWCRPHLRPFTPSLSRRRETADMMRVHQPTASCGTRFGWLLAVVAAIVIVVQASWLHSLRGVCRSVAVAQEAALRAAQHSLVALNTSAPPPCPLLAPVAATASGIHDANLSSSSLAELSTNTSLDAPPAPSAPPVVPSCARTPPRVMVVTAEQPTECSTATVRAQPDIFSAPS